MKEIRERVQRMQSRDSSRFYFYPQKKPFRFASVRLKCNGEAAPKIQMFLEEAAV